MGRPRDAREPLEKVRRVVGALFEVLDSPRPLADVDVAETPRGLAEGQILLETPAPKVAAKVICRAHLWRSGVANDLPEVIGRQGRDERWRRQLKAARQLWTYRRL